MQDLSHIATAKKGAYPSTQLHMDWKQFHGRVTPKCFPNVSLAGLTYYFANSLEHMEQIDRLKHLIWGSSTLCPMVHVKNYFVGHKKGC